MMNTNFLLSINNTKLELLDFYVKFKGISRTNLMRQLIDDWLLFNLDEIKKLPKDFVKKIKDFDVHKETNLLLNHTAKNEKLFR